MKFKHVLQSTIGMLGMVFTLAISPTLHSLAAESNFSGPDGAVAAAKTVMDYRTGDGFCRHADLGITYDSCPICNETVSYMELETPCLEVVREETGEINDSAPVLDGYRLEPYAVSNAKLQGLTKEDVIPENESVVIRDYLVYEDENDDPVGWTFQAVEITGSELEEGVENPDIAENESPAPTEASVEEETPESEPASSKVRSIAEPSALSNNEVTWTNSAGVETTGLMDELWWKALREGGKQTITLNQDLEWAHILGVTHNIENGSGKNIDMTLNLNGHVLYLTKAFTETGTNFMIMHVQSGDTFKIIDSAASGGASSFVKNAKKPENGFRQPGPGHTSVKYDNLSNLSWYTAKPVQYSSGVDDAEWTQKTANFSKMGRIDFSRIKDRATCIRVLSDGTFIAERILFTGNEFLNGFMSVDASGSAILRNCAVVNFGSEYFSNVGGIIAKDGSNVYADDSYFIRLNGLESGAFLMDNALLHLKHCVVAGCVGSNYAGGVTIGPRSEGAADSWLEIFQGGETYSTVFTGCEGKRGAGAIYCCGISEIYSQGLIVTACYSKSGAAGGVYVGDDYLQSYSWSHNTSQIFRPTFYIYPEDKRIEVSNTGNDYQDTPSTWRSFFAANYADNEEDERNTLPGRAGAIYLNRADVYLRGTYMFYNTGTTGGLTANEGRSHTAERRNDNPAYDTLIDRFLPADISNSYAYHNHARGSGGGFRLISGYYSEYAYDGYTRADRCKAIGNNAEYGGGFYLSNVGNPMTNCIAANNHTTGEGAGVYITANKDQIQYPTKLRGWQITGNSGRNGGGLYVDSYANVRLLSTNNFNYWAIKYQKQDESGNWSDETIPIYVCEDRGFTEITGNRATSKGGGVYVAANGSLHLTSYPALPSQSDQDMGIRITGNSATEYGGLYWALKTDDSNFFMTGNIEIKDNNYIRTIIVDGEEQEKLVPNSGKSDCYLPRDGLISDEVSYDLYGDYTYSGFRLGEFWFQSELDESDVIEIPVYQYLDMNPEDGELDLNTLRKLFHTVNVDKWIPMESFSTSNMISLLPRWDHSRSWIGNIC